MIRHWILILLLLLGLGCGAATTPGDDSAGPPAPPSEIPAVPDLPTRVEAATNALVLTVDTGSSESLSALRTLEVADYESEAFWDRIFDLDDGDFLQQVFGLGDENGEVTRLRVLTARFKGYLEDVIRVDPDFDCGGSTETLDEATIDLPFFGDIDNSDGAIYCSFVPSAPDSIIIHGRSGSDLD
ncbi:MAG: hypothetical protein Q7T11_07395, partial [Deltaproteobacteria bacterium]|nr:hypothetical protein [Deltaproteobacteria bacterium]